MNKKKIKLGLQVKWKNKCIKQNLNKTSNKNKNELESGEGKTWEKIILKKNKSWLESKNRTERKQETHRKLKNKGIKQKG